MLNKEIKCFMHIYIPAMDPKKFRKTEKFGIKKAMRQMINVVRNLGTYLMYLLVSYLYIIFFMNRFYSNTSMHG